MLERVAKLAAKITSLGPVVFIGLFFLLVYAVLGIIYLTSLSEQGSVRDQIARLRGITTVASSRTQDVQEEFKALQESIPPPTLMETEVFRAMRKMATDAGIDIKSVDLQYKDAIKKKVGTAEYRAMSFTMRVAGDWKAVWSVVQKLDQGESPFKTLVLERTTLNTAQSAGASATPTPGQPGGASATPTPGQPAGASAAPVVPSSASLDFIIYTRLTGP